MPRKVVTLLKKIPVEWFPGAGEREKLRVTTKGYVISFGDD